MKALWVNAETHWGLYLGYFFNTKTRPYLNIIPPSTLIGALSYPLAREMGWPENLDYKTSSGERIKRFIVGVHYSITPPPNAGGPAYYAETTKIVLYKHREKKIITDAAPMPAYYTIIPVTVDIVYIVDEIKAAETLGSRWDRRLLSAALSMTRIGMKESVISVNEAQLMKPRIREATTSIRTRFTIPLDAVRPINIEGNYYVTRIIDWRRARIGDYMGKPTTLIAQPKPGETVTIKEPGLRIMEVNQEYIVPWSSRGEPGNSLLSLSAKEGRHDDH